MYVLPQLRQLWDTFQAKLGDEGPYQVSISAMHLRLSELQESDNNIRKIRVEGLKNAYQEVDRVLYYQGLSLVLEAIQTKLISWHHNDFLAGHCDINKIKNLVRRKYYLASLRKDIEVYIKSCDIYLGSNIVRHKPYGDLPSLSIPTHWWIDLLMDFVTGLSISTNWKGGSYDSNLVIIDWLIKMVYYEPVKITINDPSLAEVIQDMVVRYYDLLDFILTDWDSLFTSKFWSSLCYFLRIK